MGGDTSGVAPWASSFEIKTDGAVVPNGLIRLDQVSKISFALGSSVRYTGAKTGLEDQGLPEPTLDNIRSVEPSQLAPDTDLASVPAPLRWFMSSYGIHTPAALIHDRLIPTDGTIEGMTDAYADRYFRFMLEDLGVPWLRRWLMWSAVAFRTLLVTRKVSAIVWVVLSLLGISALCVGVATASTGFLVASLVAPFPIAALWRHQYGAGLIAAACAPFVLPPALVAVAGYGIYVVLEFLLGIAFPGRSAATAAS